MGQLVGVWEKNKNILCYSSSYRVAKNGEIDLWNLCYLQKSKESHLLSLKVWNEERNVSVQWRRFFNVRNPIYKKKRPYFFTEYIHATDCTVAYSNSLKVVP